MLTSSLVRGADASGPPAPKPIDRLLPETEVAARLGVAVKTLQNWRVRGEGPPWVKLNGGKRAAVRYSEDRLNAYIAAQARRSTADTGEVAA